MSAAPQIYEPARKDPKRLKKLFHIHQPRKTGTTHVTETGGERERARGRGGRDGGRGRGGETMFLRHCQDRYQIKFVPAAASKKRARTIRILAYQDVEIDVDRGIYRCR